MNNTDNSDNQRAPSLLDDGRTGSQPQQPAYGVSAYGQQAYYGTPYYHSSDDDGLLGSLDLLRLFRVLKKKWGTVLLVLLFAGCATGFYLYKVKKIYRAASLL